MHHGSCSWMYRAMPVSNKRRGAIAASTISATCFGSGAERLYFSFRSGMCPGLRDQFRLLSNDAANMSHFCRLRSSAGCKLREIESNCREVDTNCPAAALRDFLSCTGAKVIPMPDTLNVLQFRAGLRAATLRVQPRHSGQHRRLRPTTAVGDCSLRPPGTYVSGTLWMRSNITIELHAGAILAAQPDVRAFPVYNSAWEGSASPGHAPLIAGEGLRNVALTGRGTIDEARGGYWWDPI